MSQADILAKINAIYLQHRVDERARLYSDLFQLLAAWRVWSGDVTAFIAQPDPRDLYDGMPIERAESLITPELPNPSVQARVVSYRSPGVHAAFDNSMRCEQRT